MRFVTTRIVLTSLVFTLMVISSCFCADLLNASTDVEFYLGVISVPLLMAMSYKSMNFIWSFK
jgi:hypothetical protein